MADIIQIRRGTASQWSSTNPVLADGELGFETDTKKGKLGDGSTAWNSLTYSFTGVVQDDVATQINDSTSKTTPVDADLLGIVDSAASNILKKLSWSNLKATLKTYFDSLYAAISHSHSASDITSGTLSVGRGGTGISSYTTGNYINASSSSALQQRTPAQVLSDIGAGYLGVPQNSQSSNYTLVIGDSGKHIFHPSADTTARTWTIPANSSVAFPIGTAITFVNQNGAGDITISITTDTMRLAGDGTTGSRTLTANGVATALKVTSTEWIISGTNLT